MTYDNIIEVLKETDTTDAAVCRAINSRMSQQGKAKLMVPTGLFRFIDRGNPHSDFLLVPFDTPEKPKEGHDGFVIREYYSFTKKSSFDKGSITLDGSVVVATMADTGNTHVVGILGHEDMGLIDWKAVIAETAPVKPKKLPREDITLTNEQAVRAIEKGMRELPLDIKGRHSHGGLRERYTYVQTLTEYAVAIGLTQQELNGTWLPTHLRTLKPLPFGGINSKREGKFSDEDKLQMKGIDIQHLPRIADKNRKTPIIKGQAYDVKLIASVGSGPYKDVPVEAFMQDVRNPTRFTFEDDTMWTWSEQGRADFVFVLRNTAYVVMKDVLRKEVRKRVRDFKANGCNWQKDLRPNNHADSKGRLKWNVWLTEDELAHLSTKIFDLPSIYGELLTEHGSSPLLDYYGDEKLGELYTNRHLRFFNPNI